VRIAFSGIQTCSTPAEEPGCKFSTLRDLDSPGRSTVTKYFLLRLCCDHEKVLQRVWQRVLHSVSYCLRAPSAICTKLPVAKRPHFQDTSTRAHLTFRFCTLTTPHTLLVASGSAEDDQDVVNRAGEKNHIWLVVLTPLKQHDEGCTIIIYHPTLFETTNQSRLTGDGSTANLYLKKYHIYPFNFGDKHP